MADTIIPTSTPLQITINPLPQAGSSQTPSSTTSSANNHGAPDSPDFWGQSGFSFQSFIDTVNPLQHIPIVSTIYQAMTGDTPSSGSNLAGGALYGGPLGFASALFNEIVKSQTGQDVSGNLMALAKGNLNIQAAQNDTTPYLSPNQRASYNAYVKASALT